MAIGTSSDMRWLAVGGSGVQYTAGDGIEIDANNEISAKVDGATITFNAGGELVATAEAQVQANWAETDTSDPAYIKNKPTIPAAQVNADWTASSGVAEILHKPTIPSATSDLTNDSGFITTSDVPAAQEQADWTENDSSDPAYIRHKPTEKSLVAGSNITITEDASNVTISATPAAVTVDQTYNSASTNPQSGTAVAGALSTINQVPASTSSDENKALIVNSSGNPTWSNTVTLSSDVHAIALVNSLPASPVSGTLYLIPET